MKNDDARNQKEEEIKRAERYFDKLQRSLDVVKKQREKENSGSYELFSNLEAWEDNPINEVFIDDVLEYAKSQKNGDSLWETLNKVYNSTDVAEIDKLPERQKHIARKKLEELRQLVDRGQRMVDAGYTKEYTDKVLRLTYEMSKDGLREALSFDITAVADEFPKKTNSFDNPILVDRNAVVKKLGWFNTSNGITKILGGKEYSSLTEYVASKTTPEAFEAIERANEWQGVGSYSKEAVLRKFAVLRSMGYDVADYDSWPDMLNAVQPEGFYLQEEVSDSKFPTCFDTFKSNPSTYRDYYEGQSVFDAAIQLVLENTDIPGNDRQNKTMILLRTEDSSVAPPIVGKNINGAFHSKTKRKFYPGVCESHSHISAFNVEGDFLTATLAPYCSVKSLWFMERGSVGDSYYPCGDFQFNILEQNESDICAKGLLIIGIGYSKQLKNAYKKAHEIVNKLRKSRENGKD